jgi:hypothetical protein
MWMPRAGVPYGRRGPRDSMGCPDEVLGTCRAVLGLLERRGRWLSYWLAFVGLITTARLALRVATGSLTSPLVFAAGVIARCCRAVRKRRRALESHHFMRAVLREERDTKRPPPLCVSAVRRGSLYERGGARIRTWEG